MAEAEVQDLIEVAADSDGTVQGFTGTERARIDAFAYLTGFRQRELASLTPQSFQLDADPPTILISAADSKHRQSDLMPLHPELKREYAAWIRSLPLEQPLFRRFAKRKAWLMVKKDSKAAGIPYETAEGQADFHALRHSFVTNLGRAHLSHAEVKHLSRHTDVNMVGRYMHADLQDQANASAKLTLQHRGSKSDGEPCPTESVAADSPAKTERPPELVSPGEHDGSVGSSLEMPSSVEMAEKWRRREWIFVGLFLDVILLLLVN